MTDAFVLNSWGPPPVPSQTAPAPVQMPAGQGGVAASPTVIPPPPPGTNAGTKHYFEEAAKKVADDDQVMRTKAQGAIEFLDMSPKVKQLYKDSPDVFGPWVGTEGYNAYLRAPAATVSSDAQKNMEKFNQVQGATKQLSTLGLKAAFGGRITNMEVGQHNAMFGGLQSASSDSAVQSLERMEQQHMNTLQHAADRGLIDPSRVPRDIVERGITSGMLEPRRFLPTIASPADASRLPSGTMFVNPAGKVLRVP